MGWDAEKKVVNENSDDHPVVETIDFHECPECYQHCIFIANRFRTHKLNRIPDDRLIQSPSSPNQGYIKRYE